MQAYPQDSETAGPHFWATMHNVVAKYPMRPSSHEKLMFKRWLEYTIDHYVCYDPCTKNARRYIRNNPPDVSSRPNLSRWLCNFHNHVREDQGKKIHNCDLVLGSPTKSAPCFGCTTPSLPGQEMAKQVPDVIPDEQRPEPVPQLTIPQPTDKVPDTIANIENTNIENRNPVQILPDVSNALHKYKKASTQIFKELCREDHIPYPDIYYKPCPSMPETSCTSFPVDNTGRVTGKASIFFHPYVYNAKTIAHEYKHYYAKMKGLDGLAADETEIEKRAMKFIEERFPSDDRHLALGEVKVYAERKITRFERRYGDIKTRWMDRFPRFGSKFKTEVVAQNTDVVVQPPASALATSQEQGFLHHFDSVYQPLEQHFGLSKEWLNAAYSPELISSITQTIIEANFSPVGSLLFSTILGLGLGGYVIAAKSGMAQGDKILLTEMSAHFVTNTIRYANRDAMQFVMDDVEKLGGAVFNMDLAQIANILVGRSMFGGYDDGEDLTHTPLPPLLPLPPRPIKPDRGLDPYASPDILFGFAAAPSKTSVPTPPPVRTIPPQVRPQGSPSVPMPVVQRTTTPTSVPVKAAYMPPTKAAITTGVQQRMAPIGAAERMAGLKGAPPAPPMMAPPPAMMTPPSTPAPTMLPSNQVAQVSQQFGLPPMQVQQLYTQFLSSPEAMDMGMGHGQGEMGMGMGHGQSRMGMGMGRGRGRDKGIIGNIADALGLGTGTGMRDEGMRDEMQEQGTAMGMGMGMGRMDRDRDSDEHRRRQGFMFFSRFISWLRGQPIIFGRQQPMATGMMGMDDSGLPPGEARRRRMQQDLVSGIDEEGFYHGEAAELTDYESGEEYESYHSEGGGSNNSINLGEDGYY